MSNPYLSQIERGLRRPSAEVLQQLAKALRISAETLYVRAGILNPEDGEVCRVRPAPPRPTSRPAKAKATRTQTAKSASKTADTAKRNIKPTTTAAKKTASATAEAATDAAAKVGD